MQPMFAVAAEHLGTTHDDVDLTVRSLELPVLVGAGPVGVWVWLVSTLFSVLVVVVIASAVVAVVAVIVAAVLIVVIIMAVVAVVAATVTVVVTVIAVEVFTTVVVPAVVVVARSLVLHWGAKLFLEDCAVLKIMTCVLMERARSIEGVVKLFPEEGGWPGGVSFCNENLGGPFSKSGGLRPCLVFFIGRLVVVVVLAMLAPWNSTCTASSVSN